MKKSKFWALLLNLYGFLELAIVIFIFFHFGFKPISFVLTITIIFLSFFPQRFFRIFQSYWIYKEGISYIDDFVLEDDIEDAKYIFGVNTKFDEKLGDFLKKTKEELLLEYIETIGYKDPSDLINKEIKTNVLKAIINYKESKLQQYFTRFLIHLSRAMIAIASIQALLVVTTLYTMPEIKEKMIFGINIKFILLGFIGFLVLAVLSYIFNMWLTRLILTKRFFKKYA